MPDMKYLGGGSETGCGGSEQWVDDDDGWWGGWMEGGGGIGEDDRGRCFTTFLEKKDRLLQTWRCKSTSCRIISSRDIANFRSLFIATASSSSEILLLRIIIIINSYLSLCFWVVDWKWNEIREWIILFFFYLGNWLTGSGLYFSSFFFFFFF